MEDFGAIDSIEVGNTHSYEISPPEMDVEEYLTAEWLYISC